MIHRRQHRLAVGETVHCGKPRHALDHRAEAGPLIVRPVLTPAGDSQDDQFWVDFEQRFGRQAHFLQHAGAEAFDEDVCAVAQRTHQCARLRLVQIEAQALFVAAIDFPMGLDVFFAPAAQRVAPGRLDLDDLRAKIAKNLRQHIASEQTRQIEDAHAIKRAARIGFIIAFVKRGFFHPFTPDPSDSELRVRSPMGARVYFFGLPNRILHRSLSILLRLSISNSGTPRSMASRTSR